MKKVLFSIVCLSFFSVVSINAQKLFVPGGLVGTSVSSSTVEVGTSTSGASLSIINSGGVRILVLGGFLELVFLHYKINIQVKITD